MGQSPPTSDRIFVTDFYDLEATIFYAGNTLDRLFSAHANKTKRQQFLFDRSTLNVLDVVTRLATPVGVLRWLSHSRGLALSMRHFPAHVTVGDDLNHVDLTELVKTAFGRSKQYVRVAETQILDALSEALNGISDGRDYCNGRDMAACLMQILRQGFGCHISVEMLLVGSRAMLSMDELKKTKFFSEMQHWANENGAAVWAAA